LRHAHHVRSMREDVMGAADMARLSSAIQALETARNRKNCDEMMRGVEHLSVVIGEVVPARSWPTIREYVEILAVALSVAMAFRSYFIQPFKIPTGSMQTTLYGIHFEPASKKQLTDLYPLNCLKWFITGEWYHEIRAVESGRVTMSVNDPNASNPIEHGIFRCQVAIFVDGVRHEIAEPQMSSHVQPGENVLKGQVLASGMKLAGDHVFVDKVSWNFRKPRRGEVMVFLTNGIEGLKKNWDKHYIKRMIGLPGEEISVNPPYVAVNGTNVTDHTIGAIARDSLGNGGYRPAEGYGDAVLSAAGKTFRLSQSQYFAMGDNTRSSFDSRYWGGVPRENLVGPGYVIYWPIVRWRHISR